MNQSRASAAFIVLLWWCAPIALQLRHSQPVMLQYLPTLLPAPFLLMALGVDALLRLPVRLPALALAALALIAGAQTATTIQFANFVGQYDTTGGYGLPVRSALSAAQQAKQANAPVIAVIRDYPTPWNEQAVILNDVLADAPHRFLNSEVEAWVFRPEGVSYIFAPGTEQALAGLLGYLDASNVLTKVTPLRDELSVGYTYVRVKSMPNLAGFTPARPAAWDSGIELTSYRLTAGSQSLRVETVLKVTQVQPENVDYHWFNHLFAGEDKLAQTDGSGIHPSAWRVGDYLLQRFDIPLNAPLPATPLQVRIGSYSYPDIKTVLVSEAGKSPEGGVNLPLNP